MDGIHMAEDRNKW